MLSKHIISNYPFLNTFFSFEHIFLSILFEHQPFFSGSFSFFNFFILQHAGNCGHKVSLTLIQATGILQRRIFKSLQVLCKTASGESQITEHNRVSKPSFSEICVIILFFCLCGFHLLFFQFPQVKT